jgi:hypothetical protein
MSGMLRGAGLVLILGLSLASSRASPPTSKRTIELGEMTVTLDGNPIAKLHKDGRTETIGNTTPGQNATFSPGPTLHADGTIKLTKGGYKARVGADGKIFVVSPEASEQLFGRIVGDQLLTGSGHAGIRVDGNKLVEFADGKDTGVMGVVDPPRMKRAALVMTAAFFIDMFIVR